MADKEMIQQLIDTLERVEAKVDELHTNVNKIASKVDVIDVLIYRVGLDKLDD